jgi:hypothetical protein
MPFRLRLYSRGSFRKVWATPESAGGEKKSERAFSAHSLQLREGLVVLESLSKGNHSYVTNVMPVNSAW